MFHPLVRSRTKTRRVPLPRRFQLEALEPRCVLSAKLGADALPAAFDQEPNDTADVAQVLNVQDANGATGVRGTIGGVGADGADVDWFSFELDEPAVVSHTASGAIDIGLYLSAPFDADRFSQAGARLLEQSASHHLKRTLAAGSYLLAISGAGNDAFHPYLADSGVDGAMGDYQFEISAAPLYSNPSDGPAVIAADPADHATVSDSPFVLRYTLSSLLNPDTAIAGDTVRLVYNPSGAFGDGNDQDVALDAVDFSAASGEIQLTPSAPLGPGFYQVVLLGDQSVNFDILADLNGVPFGATAEHSQGQDAYFTFQITGNEGNTNVNAIPDDTPTGAHELGELSSAGFVQQSGAIGDDPRSLLRDADVDLYHFQLSGPDRYAVFAEVFARRIGSPLDPGVSLFRCDPSDGQLTLIAANDNTLNDIPATNGKSVPLLSDSLVTAGLTAGDYYVAVSSRGNVPDAARGSLPGVDGIFDPNVSLSGAAGLSYGPYLLNVFARADNVPPTVVSVSSDVSPDAAPTQLVVRFSEPVNVRQLAFSAFEQAGTAALPAVSVETADGGRVYPRLLRFDDATNQATFQMLDRLPAGTSTLHLSGALGLTDYAGNALIGDDGSGDYTAPILVAASTDSRNQGPEALTWHSQEPNDDSSEPQEIGVLFPHELQAGVVIHRDAAARLDSSDVYRIEVLQDQTYFFFLTGTGLQLSLFDARGNIVPTSAQGTDGQLALITAGAYFIEVTGWTAAHAAQISYDLRITLGGNGENPPPLTSGPAPLIRSRLTIAAPAETAPPQVFLPIISGPTSNPTNPAPGERQNGSTPTPLIVLSSLTSPSATTASPNPPPLSAPFAALAAGPSRATLLAGVGGSLGNLASDRVVLQSTTTIIPTLIIGPGQNAPAPSGFFVPAIQGVGIDFATLARGIKEGQRLLHRLWTNTLDRIFTLIDPDNESGAELEAELTADLPPYQECALPFWAAGAAALGLLLGECQKKTQKPHWPLQRHALGSRGDEFVDCPFSIR